jgi:hypothetical protein
MNDDGIYVEITDKTVKFKKNQEKDNTIYYIERSI